MSRLILTLIGNLTLKRFSQFHDFSQDTRALPGARTCTEEVSKQISIVRFCLP